MNKQTNIHNLILIALVVFISITATAFLFHDTTFGHKTIFLIFCAILILVLLALIIGNGAVITKSGQSQQPDGNTEYRSIIVRQHKRIKTLEYKLKRSRISSSAGRIRHHFIYNSLNSISEIMLTNPAYASELLDDFTIYLRTCISTVDKTQLIPFSRELENIKAYVKIEKMRLGERLTFNCDLEDTDFDICTLSIQPFIENAIKHGIYDRGPEGGTVTLTTRSLKDHRLICISDDGIGFNVKNTLQEIRLNRTDSIGMSNTIFRLKEIMGAEIEISSVINKGSVIRVLIPKHTQYD